MKILVTGSRKLDTEEAYQRLSEKLGNLVPDLVLHGGAKGVDSMAERWANAANVPTLVLKPEYDKYLPKLAPLKRNDELVKIAEEVVAMYAIGRERKGGTWYTVQKSVKAGLPVLELLPDEVDVFTPGRNELF